MAEIKEKRNSCSYLTFALGKELYAIPLLTVKEVIGLPEVTTVPQTPAFFLGITNHHGQIISILDLRMKLGVQPKRTKETAVIVCDLQPNAIGVVVDSIQGVIRPNEEQFLEKPEIQSHKTTEYITEVIRRENQLILLLDIGKTITLVEQKPSADAAVNKAKAA